MFRLLLAVLLTALLLSACSDTKPDKAATDAAPHQAQPTAFQQNSAKLFERVTTVLEGYQAFSGKLPLQLQDLDAGGYMFDSAYLADVLPQDVLLYLELSANRGATRMWLQQAGQDQILSRTLADPQLQKMTVDDLQALKASWQEIAKVGRLTQVKL